MDKITTVEELKRAVAEFRDERDWRQFHTPKDLAIAISEEANELLSIFRFKTDEEIEDPEKLAHFREELADVFITALSLSDVTDTNVSQIIKDKIVKIKQKYPIEKAKGSTKKYTEL